LQGHFKGKAMSIVKTTNSTHEKKSVKKSDIFDPFAGGRFLMAIAENQNLTADETLILLIIGSHQDFNDFLHSKRYMTIERIAFLAKRTERWIKKCLRSLEQKGYLITEECFRKSGKQLANNYSLSDIIFTDAHQNWLSSRGEYSSPHKVTEGEYSSPPGVNTVHPQIPNKEVPNIKKGKSKDLPKKGITQNKKWELRQCQDMGIDVFTPDADQQGRIPNPGRRAIELHMSEMHQRYGYQAVKLFIDDLKDQGLRGKALFNRGKIDNAVKAAFEFLQQKNSEAISESSQRIQDQPIPF
jgi:hypothetical protein